MDLFDKIRDFKLYLTEEEKSLATVEKYTRDVKAFCSFINGRQLTKHEVIEYKNKIADEYAATSVNSMIISVNSFLRFIKCHECCVKLLKIQRQIFINEEKELTVTEYKRLINTAKGTRLGLIIRTICETGIRVSELKHITVSALENGKAVVKCKSKTRIIFIPVTLRKLLLKYVKKNGISDGSVFVTKNGKSMKIY